MANIRILLFSLCLSLLLYPSASYNPKDLILLDCGSSGTQKADDGRQWTGDIDSKLAPSDDRAGSGGKSQTLKADSQVTSVEAVPYMTARLSRSSFNYTFSVTISGPKFVRLYFYPASYSSNGGGGGGFNRSAALFSVKSGPYTLLNNFSAALTADSMALGSFSREFSINVKEKSRALTLTFAPSSNSYAFINGIEIVSMPTDLYYAPPLGNANTILLGTTRNNITVNDNTLLETVYRLNVGGSSISPVNDSDLFRYWSEDLDYILSPSFLPIYRNVNINYTKVPNYTAPDEVYSTARTMGPDYSVNEKLNMSWNFPVDGAFSYLVRLHFCEYQPQVTLPGDRPFFVYIENRTAENDGDVIKWSGGNRVAVYRDYILMLNTERNMRNRNHSVFLTLHPIIRSGSYTNVILNGVEMFKLNDTNGNLASPNPPPVVSPSQNKLPPPPPITAKKKSDKTVLVIVAVSIGCGFVLFSLLALTFFLLWRRRRNKNIKGSSSLSETKDNSSSLLPHSLCRQFSLAEIQAATSDFDVALFIDGGGFGKVYRGRIDGDSKTVAIKRLSVESKQGDREFVAEIQTLSQLRHHNLVSLIGYCDEDPEKILVYEYMPNGTLSNHLYGQDRSRLPWKLRLEISIGAARGLHYLHAEASQTIIHRDVKPSNILLDENWVAKVSDFGLSKIGPASMPEAGLPTGTLKGTHGYLDPEFISCMTITEKSDVYAFGVVLLEVLLARKAVDNKLEEDEIHMARWAKTCIRNGTLGQKIDPYLTGQIALPCFRIFVEVAKRCLRRHGANRPTMRDVVGDLNLALQLQEECEAEASPKDGGGVTKAFPELTLEYCSAMAGDGGDGSGFLDSTTMNEITGGGGGSGMTSGMFDSDGTPSTSGDDTKN